jgi:hypothetical protein
LSATKTPTKVGVGVGGVGVMASPADSLSSPTSAPASVSSPYAPSSLLSPTRGYGSVEDGQGQGYSSNDSESKPMNSIASAKASALRNTNTKKNKKNKRRVFLLSASFHLTPHYTTAKQLFHLLLALVGGEWFDRNTMYSDCM